MTLEFFIPSLIITIVLGLSMAAFNYWRDGWAGFNISMNLFVDPATIIMFIIIIGFDGGDFDKYTVVQQVIVSTIAIVFPGIYTYKNYKQWRNTIKYERINKQILIAKASVEEINNKIGSKIAVKHLIELLESCGGNTSSFADDKNVGIINALSDQLKRDEELIKILEEKRSAIK